jgi:hypothetical protein
MKLRNRCDALETKRGTSPTDLVIFSTLEQATSARRNLPPEAVVIVTGVPRTTKETRT